jgi:hypothetical protein
MTAPAEVCPGLPALRSNLESHQPCDRPWPTAPAARSRSHPSRGLSIAATSFDGTITTWLVEAEANGDAAVRLERLTDLARHFPADAEIAITADDTRGTTGQS